MAAPALSSVLRVLVLLGTAPLADALPSLRPPEAPVQPLVWQGMLSYPCTADCDGAEWLVHNGAMNITVHPGSALADVRWTWTVLPGHGTTKHCLPRLESGLKVSTDGRQWFARGSGTDPTYYSLEATLSADGNTLSDGIIYMGAKWPGKAAGTFTARKGGPPPRGSHACVPPPPGPPAPPPPLFNLWPLPRNFSRSAGAAPLLVPAASFQFGCEPAGPCAGVLTAAFARYSQQIFAEHESGGNGGGGGGGGLTSLSCTVESAEEHATLQFGMDESYTLQIPGAAGSSSGGQQQHATLTAPTVWGALRGLTTFAQLVEWDWDNHTHVIHGAPWRIEDSPRFPHRSFMLDSARHYQPLPVFGRLLDGMAAAKLNTLHWHISDAQSVAFESQRYPKIWEGRFSQDERYSTADMAWVVEQARLRGIRVELELDFPAHASSFCRGYPELCANVSDTGLNGGHCGLDVSKNRTFEFIDGLVQELGTAAAATARSAQAAPSAAPPRARPAQNPRPALCGAHS